MADEKRNIIELIKEASSECEESFKTLYDEMEEDLRFYAGGDGQWDEDDINAIKSTHNVQITINVIKKQIDTLLGRREQTLTDLKAYPVEFNDDTFSFVVSRLLKWTLDSANSQSFISQAYKNQLGPGMGWLFIDTDETGFIRLHSESPLNIYFDPYCKDLLGLSDCDYILRYKQTTKRELKRVFPDKQDEIAEIKSSDDTLYRYTEGSAKRKEKVVVKEYWYRDDEPVTWIINSEDLLDAEPWNGEDEELQFHLAMNPHLYTEERLSPVIKVSTVSGSVILQEDVIFSRGNEYPFIPFVGYYSDALDDWEYKLMGHTRNLKDLQRELNARHCALMAVTQKTPLGTWIYEEGSIKDVDDLKRQGGKIGAMQYRRGSNPPQLSPQQGLPSGEVQLLQLFSGDINQVGLAPEVTGAPSALESAKAISLVQAVGLTSVAELNSHLNFALRKLGLYVIKLITEQFPREKIQRILRSEIDDETYSLLKDDLRYNIEIDETSRSVTSQMAAFESLIQQAQHGVPVPPQALITQNPFLTPEVKQETLQQQQQMLQQQQEMQRAQLLAQSPKG
jgi:hypothetical protein